MLIKQSVAEDILSVFKIIDVIMKLFLTSFKLKPTLNIQRVFYLHVEFSVF